MTGNDENMRVLHVPMQNPPRKHHCHREEVHHDQQLLDRLLRKQKREQETQMQVLRMQVLVHKQLDQLVRKLAAQRETRRRDDNTERCSSWVSWSIQNFNQRPCQQCLRLQEKRS
jgi:hypothetical protein